MAYNCIITFISLRIVGVWTKHVPIEYSFPGVKIFAAFKEYISPPHNLKERLLSEQNLKEVDDFNI